ncbi:MAG: M23 family metallopeptidase [Leptolyngbyaceae cyanobacterium SM1_1_3]|nr:M23 family metallopeptidase [Leptolyngbyaceae cyanobacterium SM1_1_3]NJN03520.1 M23 family metallopeptidase [Leptolyngbyaceae cyanobacterium RM1_1_2]NJO10261.1 M23 family metallopeptidase [Leptolyngbyaceae cyanobacterium SL_1_1]
MKRFTSHRSVAHSDRHFSLRAASSSLRSQFSLYTGALLVSGLLLWGVAENSPQPQKVSAVEPSRESAQQYAWASASFPVENFQAYTSPFGYRNSPYGGASQFHYGLDMAAPSGSYIRNWWAGRVVEVSDDSACGTSVIVESGQWTHVYCHMQGYTTTEGGQRVLIDRDGGLRIVEGQQIGSGARIGRVGMTGRTTGPHLHWGLKYDGSWVDPALVLRAMYSQQAAR